MSDSDSKDQKDQKPSESSEPKSFTQEELDRQFADRAKRAAEAERKRITEEYGDPAELKKAADRLGEIEEANATEAEKTAKRAEEAEKRATEAEAALEREKLEKVKLSALSEAGLPANLLKRVLGEDEESIRADVAELEESYGGKKAPDLGGDSTPAKPRSDGKITREQAEKLSVADYNKAKKEGKLADE